MVIPQAYQRGRFQLKPSLVLPLQATCPTLHLAGTLLLDSVLANSFCSRSGTDGLQDVRHAPPPRAC